jgi:hypothetical protein
MAMTPEKPPTRQAQERPESIVVKKDERGSWWIGLSREEFYVVVREKAAHMRASKVGS